MPHLSHNYVIYILYDVHILSQFIQTPQGPLLDAALQLLCHLKGSLGYGILVSSNSTFCDVDWAACLTTQRSTIGYCTFIASSPISRRIKKRHTISRSYVEAEYRAMVQITCELQWLHYLLHDLGLSHPKPMTLHCGNQALPVFMKGQNIFR